MNFLMKHKKFKKVLIAMLIILTVFNFLCPFVNATKQEEMEKLAKDDATISVGDVLDGILGILFILQRAKLSLVGKSIDWIMDSFNSDYRQEMDISTILFNKIELTDINFFDIDGASNEVVKSLRKAVSNWYVGIRNIAAALLIIICIYVGIRLALALTSEEKAKYKNMLIDWISSVALLFALHYIMVFIIAANNTIVRGIENGLESSEAGVRSITHLSDQFFAYTWITPEGRFQWGFVPGMLNAILYIMIQLMTLVFLVMYIRRMVTIAFLIVLAPLVTITYSIDKISDGKAQGMNTWFREFTYNVLIQPFQCIIFAALITIAKTMVNNSSLESLSSGFIALFLVIFIFEAEKLIKHIFNIRSSSLGDAVASAAVAATIAQKSMAYGSQVKGQVEKKLAAGNKTRPELKKQKQSDRYMKLKGGKYGKYVAPLYKKKLQVGNAIRKKSRALDKTIAGNRALRLGRYIGRGVYRATSKAGNVMFKAGMGFAISGAMGQDEVAVATAINQGYKGIKENREKEKAYKAGAQKHKIARAYNDLKDEELEKITEEYLASGKNQGKTEAQQAEEIDKIFNDKVMDLFTGAEIATTQKQNRLLASMKDYGIFLTNIGKSKDEQFDELARIIDGIDSGSIGELWSADDYAGLGVIPTYHLGETNKGTSRSHKTIISERLTKAKEEAEKEIKSKRTQDRERIARGEVTRAQIQEENRQIRRAHSRRGVGGGIIKEDIKIREAKNNEELDLDELDRKFEQQRRGRNKDT